MGPRGRGLVSIAHVPHQCSALQQVGLSTGKIRCKQRALLPTNQARRREKGVSTGFCAKSLCYHKGRWREGHQVANAHRRYQEGSPLLLVGGRAILELKSADRRSSAESLSLFTMLLLNRLEKQYPFISSWFLSDSEKECCKLQLCKVWLPYPSAMC